MATAGFELAKVMVPTLLDVGAVRVKFGLVVVFNVEGLTFREALVILSLVRVVIALSPIPGGTGLAEVGLIVLLERAGVNTVDATGMTLLYRFLTWFLPIVIGSVTWSRYNHTRSINLTNHNQ